ncbi:MAG: hypothetical protein ABJA98_06920 [Acidobacteriota bacterium]
MHGRREDATRRYVGEFKRGDKIRLTWATPRPGETEAIIYVGRDEAGSGKWGYVLPAEFVSADTAAQRLTLTTAVPSQAINTRQTVPSGGWIKVTTPFDQRNGTATIERVEVVAGPTLPRRSPDGTDSRDEDAGKPRPAAEGGRMAVPPRPSDATIREFLTALASADSNNGAVPAAAVAAAMGARDQSFAATSRLVSSHLPLTRSMVSKL